MSRANIITLGLQKQAGHNQMTWKQIGAIEGISGNDAQRIVEQHLKQHTIEPKSYEKGRERFLIFSDTHIPDHDEKLVLEIVRRNAFVDYIIINGDVLDCKAVSSFFNEDITILDHEMIEGHKLLTKIRLMTKAKIILVKGNHEQRMNSHYAKYAKQMGTSVVETEILYKLANGFSVKHKDKRIEYKAIKDVYYAGGRTFIYGDLLVNHPSNFSKMYMKTVTTMYTEKFKDKYPNAKNIIIGHTHKAGLIHIERGVTLIECGCTCKTMSYAENDDRPSSTQQHAYVYLETKDGVADKRSISLVHMGFVDSLRDYDDEDVTEEL